MTSQMRDANSCLRPERVGGLRLLANPGPQDTEAHQPLIADVVRDPFAGIGKPEALKHILTGAWSRRIDEANRLVYFVTDKHIVILQAREHY